MVIAANLVKWLLAAALGAAALVSLVLIAPLVLLYFLYSRTLEFVESFRTRPEPIKQEPKFMSNAVSMALSSFLKR